MSDQKKTSVPGLPKQVGMLLGVFQSLRLAWALFWDPRVPRKVKIIWLVTWIYIISPIDFLPAAVVGPLGLADDLMALVFGTGFFISSCPPDVVFGHRSRLFPPPPETD